MKILLFICFLILTLHANDSKNKQLYNNILKAAKSASYITDEKSKVSSIEEKNQIIPAEIKLSYDANDKSDPINIAIANEKQHNIHKNYEDNSNCTGSFNDRYDSYCQNSNDNNFYNRSQQNHNGYDPRYGDQRNNPKYKGRF